MFLFEKDFEFKSVLGHQRLLQHFREACLGSIPAGITPVRFVVTATSESTYHCEVGLVGGCPNSHRHSTNSIFDFRKRHTENTAQFNVAFLVPTGIGAEIGGHAGDAGPVSRMLAEVCDTLVLHPNVVNASDLNEMPNNSVYVEGSVLTRLLMGTIGLQPVRSNRVLVAIDNHRDQTYVNAAVNAVSGARAAYGLSCPEVVSLEPPVRMQASFASSGRSAGQVDQLEPLCELLNDQAGKYDAVALSSVIQVPYEFHQGYFDAGGNMVNPWGGVESMLTHTISSIYDVPSAHSPMLESQAAMEVDTGVVDPRLAAEAISLTFLQSVLKGLQRSPRIVTEPAEMGAPHVLSVEDVSCLVIPDGCLGLPTAAALQQGIPVIAVRENENLMRNDLSRLPWRAGQYHLVDNYWEAAGVMAAMRAGIDPGAVRRPIRQVTAERAGHVSGRA
jgi:hypothetical protein